MRAIYQFGKTRRLMCVSHLDLQRFMQMAIRRTDLPVAYSQGFNPHPLLSFASALAMGWTSDCELMDIKMAEDVKADYAMAQMRKALPPDLPLKQVRLVDDRFPALMARLAFSDYQIALTGEGSAQIAGAMADYLAQTEVIALRKTKSGEKPANIRPMSVCLESKQTEDGIVIDARLQLTEAGTLKPDLLLRVLAERAGVAVPELVRIHRTQLLALDGAGVPVDLFALQA
ncbi:MAG: TIGR03936 family radical SAM-associated protein [Clostridia bacterium]